MLVPYHVAPLASYYEEWLAAVLLLMATLAVAWTSRNRPVVVPPQAAPLLILLAVLVAQLVLGRYVAVEHVRGALLYVLAATVAFWLGTELAHLHGRRAVCSLFAFALAAGAFLNALIGIVQVTTPLDWHGHAWAVMSPLVQGTRAYGNLNQANLLADYMVCGVAALTYLFATGRVAPRAAAMALVPMLIALALTGSRMALLLFSVSTVLAILYGRRSADPRARRIVRFAVASFVLFLLMNPLLDVLGLTDADRSIVTRFTNINHAESPGTRFAVRWTLWSQAFRMFADAPLLGQGVGTYAWEFFRRSTEVDPSTIVSGSTHAHNLFMQLLAETGLIGALAVCAMLVTWWAGRLRRLTTAEHWLLSTLVAVICVHSLLEWPLWMMHFLVPFGLALGAGATVAKRVGGNASRLPAIAALAALGGLVLAASLLSVRQEMIETLQAERPARPPTEAERSHDLIVVERLQKSLLRPYAEALLMSGTIDIERLDETARINERVTRYRPFPYSVCRQILLYGLQHRGEEAEWLAARLAVVFPRDAEGCLAMVEKAERRGAASLGATSAHLRRAISRRNAQSPPKSG